MTSPTITKSSKPAEKKSPTHSANGTDVPPTATQPTTSAAPPQPTETFSWLRVFKLADLMMKQGC